MSLLLRCLFEVQFFVEKYALFLGWCWNFLQFFFRVCGKESNSNFLLGMPGMPSFVGDPQFGDPYFPSKKRSPLPSLTAKLLQFWS